MPVPRRLLHVYAKADEALADLVARIKTGEANRSQITHTLNAILQTQSSAFRKFFPPVWGCQFTAVFDRVIQARSALATQLAQIDSGTRPPPSALAADESSLQTLVGILRACRPSPGRPVGTPASAIAAVERLDASASALQRSQMPLATLRNKLRALDHRLNTTLQTGFPAVFGISYSDLVDTVLAEQSAAAQTKAAAAEAQGLATAALQKAARSQQNIASALKRQQSRSRKGEKAHS